MLKPETKQKVKEHAQAMVDLLDLKQGHLEVHCHKGQAKDVVVVDKSIKLDKEQSNA